MKRTFRLLFCFSFQFLFCLTILWSQSRHQNINNNFSTNYQSLLSSLKQFSNFNINFSILNSRFLIINEFHACTFLFLLMFVMFDDHDKTFDRVYVCFWQRKSSINRFKTLYQIVSSTSVNSKSNDVCVASNVVNALMFNTMWTLLCFFSTSLMCVIRARKRIQMRLLSKNRQKMRKNAQEVCQTSRRRASSLCRILNERFYSIEDRSSQNQVDNQTYRDLSQKSSSQEENFYDREFSHRFQHKSRRHQNRFAKNVKYVSSYQSIERNEYRRL